MRLRGIYKDLSGWAQLLLLVGFFFVGAVIAELIGYVVIFIYILISSGVDSDIINMITSGALLENPSYQRLLQFFAAIGMFVLPAFACAYLFSDDYKEYLSLKTPSNYKVYLLTVLFVVIGLPFINFTTQLNQQMVLPEWLSGLEDWMRRMEDMLAEATEMLLKDFSVWALLANLVVVAVLAGVGEELFFRGVGQNIAAKFIKNQHIVIWVVAIIFSAMHMQFYGFLPRMLMGAYLGYLLYFTRDMWVPILAHFTNNAVSLLLYYFYQDSTEEMEQIDALGWGDTWWMAVASFALLLFILFRIKRQGEKTIAHG